MPYQLGTRVSDETKRQSDYLREVHGYSLRDVVTVAIDRLYHQVRENEEASMLDEYGFDTRLLALAEAIHGEVCGCDNKRCTLTGEIYDWLYSGDVDDDATVDDLVAEWREYNAAAEDADARADIPPYWYRGAIMDAIGADDWPQVRREYEGMNVDEVTTALNEMGVGAEPSAIYNRSLAQGIIDRLAEYDAEYDA